MDTDLDIMEVENRDLDREGELIWKTPLNQIPDLPYLRKESIPWTKDPPIIPKDHYTQFGERLIKIVEDEILKLWILNRSELYGLLEDHFYPRSFDTAGGRAQLVYNLAKNPLELRWAAAWLTYKRMGGLLDQREVDEFPCKIEENLPENYQKLQEIEGDKQYKFASGQISMKRRIIEISQDQNELLRWIGMNAKAINAITASLKVFNQKTNKLKSLVDEIHQVGKDTQGGKNIIIKSNEAGNKIQGQNVDSTFCTTKEHESLKTKLETVEKKLLELTNKTKTLETRDQNRVKKNLARKFYRLRHKTKKPLIPPGTTVKDTIVEESDNEAQEEEEEMLNRSY